MNLDDDLNVVITLTFEKPVTSYSIALAEWQLFLKRLRHLCDKPLKYICVWEYQKQRSENLGITNGDVFHFHCLMNIGFIEHKKLEKLCGNGYVWIDSLSSDAKRHNAILYTTRMNNDAINNVLRRLNRMLKTPQKGNHSIRKTCISNMGASKVLTDEEIRMFAGHKDFSTTAKHYMYVTDTMDNRSSAYETAIGSKMNNVFNSVQTL